MTIISQTAPRPIHKSNKGGCKDSELEEKYIQEAS